MARKKAKDELTLEQEVPPTHADGQNAADEAPDQTPPFSADEEAEDVAVEEDEGQIKEGVEPPSTFTFTADVEHVYDEKYVLQVTNEQGGTASLEFHKEDVTFAGEEINVDLEEGYKGIEFTTSWDIAVEKHLPEFLGVSMPAQVEAVDSDDDTPPQAKNPATNRKFLRSESVTAFVPLTEKEIEACAESMAEHAMQAAALEDEKKAYDKAMKTRIDAANDEVYRAAKVYREKNEERTVSCNVVADYDAGELVWVEKEWPHREIIRRAMTEKDRQLPLPIETAPAPQPQEASAPAEPETVTLHGRLVGISEGNITIAFEDNEGEEMEFELLRADVSFEGDLQPGDCADFTMLLSLAIEEGIVDAPEGTASFFRECETCIHHDMPDDDACDRCDDSMSGWYPSAEDTQEEEPTERSCGTCAHIHAVPDPDGGEVDSPCQTCGDGELPNWTPAAIPAGGETHAEAVTQ